MTEQELEEYKRLNKIETVDVKGDKKLKETYNAYANYIMITLMMIVQLGISVLSSVDGDIRDAFPKTTLEWIIWIAIRSITAVVTFMIFDSFLKEGEKKGKQSEQYKRANEKYMSLYGANISREVKTVSPRVFIAKQRGVKALKLVLSAVLTGVAIAEATINLDLTGLLGTVVSLVMMNVWGYQKQLEVESYFINEYPIYVAVEEYKLKKLEVKEDDHNRQSDLQESSGTSSEK